MNEFLDYDRFTELGFELDKSKFDEYITMAEDQLSVITRRFYMRADFDTDYTFRKLCYQKAIGYQIMYMFSQNIKSADDVLDKPSSVSQSIGGTIVSKTYGNSGNANTSRKSAVSSEAINQLSGTGLLYRGVLYD